MPRRECLVCGSRRFRKNTVGLVTCSEGHVLQHYINESGEADDVGTHIMNKRTLKANRDKKQRASGADPKLYYGDRAHFHYYQCLQLLFRKQVAALIALWNLPPEFETICRDLWAFHLHLIPNPPPAEPFHYSREQEGLRCELEETRKGDDGQTELTNVEDVLGSQSAAPEPGSSSEDELIAPDIAVLLEENSDISLSDDGSIDEPHARKDAHSSTQKSFVSHADRPESTIVLLVLACWAIRLPVIYMDFINAIESQSLPYLDLVHTFPSSLTRHLTKHAAQALTPHHAPKTLSLHRLTAHLANRLYDRFGVIIPEVNVAPVLWRIVQECFCGTPMLYVLTKKIGNVLCLGLALSGSSVNSSSSSIRGDGDGQKHDNTPPETTLVAAAIVVLKFVYGLDERTRLPRHSDDAACAFPDMNEFLAALKGVDHVERRVSSSRWFGSRVPLSVADLDEQALDEYLDFCQKVLIRPKKEEHAVDISRHFPLANVTTDQTRNERVELRGRGLSSATKNSDDDGIFEPGEMYTIYDAKDVLGNLSGDLKMLIERSARWAGIECDFLCGVVERCERRLMRWWNDSRQGG